MIKDRTTVKARTKLTATYKGTTYECQVSETDSELVYTVNGRSFQSITGAARWVVGGCPEGEPKDLPHRSGWSFWSIAPEPSAEAPTPEETAPKKKVTSKPKAAKAS